MNTHAQLMSLGPDLDKALAELKRRDIKFIDYKRLPSGKWLFKVMVNPKHFEKEKP